MEKVKNKKVLLGLSGGVDSSVSAYLLSKSGYDVIGVTLKLHQIEISQDASKVADKLGIPYQIINMEADFKKYVIDYFIQEYNSARTPNPCTICNRYIKFEGLIEKAKELHIDFVATGHYANIEKIDSKYLLKKAKDLTKDQSYFLYNLTQEQLSKTIFPLGNLTKKEVRDIAQKIGLKVATKPDSQEICFIKDNNYKNFLAKNSRNKPVPGEFISTDGEVIGEHKGISNYTIGQRRALGIVTGSPMFVVDIIKETNQIVLGNESELLSKELIAKKLNWISIDTLDKEINANVKIRYRAKESNAKLIPLDNGDVKIVFETPQRAITKGQSVVFYDKDVVIGGGIIS